MTHHDSESDSDFEASSTITEPRELRLTAKAVKTLREHLFQDTEQERFAYCTATLTAEALLVTEAAVHPIPDDAMVTASPTAANLTQDAERDWLEHCLETGTTPVLVHSHPPGASAAFSGDWGTADVQAACAYDRFTAQLHPDHGFVFGVLTQETFHATYTPPLTALDDSDPMLPRPVAPLEISVRGAWRLDPPLTTWTSDRQNRPVTTREGTPAAIGLDEQRFDRQLRILTAADQYALQDANVTIVGAGGIGSWLAAFLARIGVGHISLVDPDVVEESNLPRLYGAAPADIGEPKVEVIAETINTMLSERAADDELYDAYHGAAADTPPTVQPVADPIEAVPELVRTPDVVVSTVDNHATVLWLHDAAVAHLQPLVDAGTLIQLDKEGDATPPNLDVTNTVASMQATCQVTVPGVTACRTCLDRVDHEQARLDWLTPDERAAEVERSYVADTVLTPDPAVLFLNGIAVSLAAQQVVRILTGFEDPAGIVEFDALTFDVRTWQTAPAPGCVVCSPGVGLLGTGTLGSGAANTPRAER